MCTKTLARGLVVFIPLFLCACGSNNSQTLSSLVNGQTGGWLPGASDKGLRLQTAHKPDSPADKLMSSSAAAFFGSTQWNESDVRNCDTDNAGIVTVYATNSQALSEIEIRLDGRHVGSLRTYFPDSVPDCKTANAAGVITRWVAAGEHMVEAASLNLQWPRHDFVVEKCACMAIQLP